MLKEGKSKICHNVEDVTAFMEQHCSKKQIEEYYSDKYVRYWKGTLGMRQKDFHEYFDTFEKQQNTYVDIFLKNECPVFVASYSKSNMAELVFHGRKEKENVFIPGAKKIETKRLRVSDRVMLKDYEFYKIFDTQSAFQEIHMYLSGVLGFSNPHVPVPDDVTMRDIKGFDKFSFKKPPSKRK